MHQNKPKKNTIMKNRLKKASLAAIVLCAGYSFLNSAQAQTTGWGEGSRLQDAEVVVEKDRKIELPRASRNYQKFAVVAPEPGDRNVRYRFNDYRLENQDVNLQMRVLTIKQDELDKLYGNYVKGGIGNYGTLYLKGYFHNKRSNVASYGADVSHIGSARGPVDGGNSAVANTALNVNGETYMQGLTLGGKLGYGRDKYHFYGYSPDIEPTIDKADIRQLFNRVSAEGYMHNHTSGMPLMFKAGLNVNYLNDRFDMSETNIAAKLNSEYGLDDVSAFRVDADVSVVSHKDAESTSRSFVKVHPQYERQLNALRISIGANIAYTGDQVNDPRQFNVYPTVRVGVEPIKDNLLIYGGIGGDLQRVTLFGLTQENPFLAPNVQVADINKGLEVYGGLQANVANYVHLTGRVAYQNIRNLYFYNNTEADPSKFELLYDDGVTNVLNIYGEASFNYSDELRIGLKADYNKYSLASLEQAFHRPELMASVFANYNFYDKVLLNTELYYIGSSFGRTYLPDGTFGLRETDTIVDLNLKADYRFTNRFTTFVMVNNLFAQKYERFVNYPNKSINLIGGVSYSF